MFTNGISPATERCLETLKKTTLTSNYYLTGGTVAALYLGHRISYALDFFSNSPLGPIQIAQELGKLGKLQTDQNDAGTFLGMLDGVKIGFFRYLYPMVEPEQSFEGVRIASLMDIGCMKLEAIASRGIMRNFVDMYLIAQKLGLENVLTAARTKFASTDYSETHFLRSLAYFADADTANPPTMLVAWDWEEIMHYFEQEVKRVSQVGDIDCDKACAGRGGSL